MKKAIVTVGVVLTLAGMPGLKAKDASPATSDPSKVDADYALQGEYEGSSGDEKLGVQVIARGGGKFEAVACKGGLPGSGWNKEKPRERIQAELVDGKVKFVASKGHVGWLADGKILVQDPEGKDVGSLQRVIRKSPTLGKKAPEGAVVVFDGTSTDGFKEGKMEGKLLTQGALSKEAFGDHSIHIEFRLPYMPAARGQGRGNSGIYVQGRYETQMLDSFGLTGKDNECGGLYKASVPSENMCYPPLTWQTYDIDFTAAKFEGGKKINNANITVKHNGVMIHDKVELSAPTPGGKLKTEDGPGPIYLQNHGNPVRYRNIWVVKN